MIPWEDEEPRLDARALAADDATAGLAESADVVALADVARTSPATGQ